MPWRGENIRNKQSQHFRKAQGRLVLLHLSIFLGSAVMLTWFFIQQGLIFEDYFMALLSYGLLFLGVAAGPVPALLGALALIFAYGSVKVGAALWFPQYAGVDASRIFWLVTLPAASFLGGNLRRLWQHQQERLSFLEVQVEDLVSVDDLTGLENARRFAFRTVEEIARSRRYGGVFSLVLVQVRFLREMADVHGSRARDLVLKKVATTLEEQKRIEDFLAVLEPGEFAFLLPATNREGAQVLRSRLRQKLQHVDVSLAANDFRRVRLTLATGVGSFPEDGEEYMLLLAAARRDYEYDR